MTESVMFVDDEENILNSIERLFIDIDVKVLTANSAQDALDLLGREDIAVLVTDNLMPGMKGIDLLSKAKDISPDTVKIIMTAHADLPTAVDAINRGEVFRFIIKPWKNDALLDAVEEGVNRYRMIRSLKRADEPMLLSLAQAIELKDPYTRGHCDRVAAYSLMIAESLALDEAMRLDIKYGSWLHDCGKIGVPEKILNNHGPIDELGYEIIKKHPLWGADVARQARLSEGVVNIILYHHERYDGLGYPSGRSGRNIPLEARIVAVADVYDALITDRPYRRRYSEEEAIDIILSMKGRHLDTEIVDVFLGILSSRQAGPQPPEGMERTDA